MVEVLVIGIRSYIEMNGTASEFQWFAGIGGFDVSDSLQGMPLMTFLRKVWIALNVEVQ